MGVEQREGVLHVVIQFVSVCVSVLCVLERGENRKYDLGFDLDETPDQSR